MNNNLQITIRGLDANTKSALVKKAHQKGVSLNQYALASLKQTAGIETSEERYQRMKQFLDKHHISEEDAQAINEAVEWLDKTSLEKQKRDEHDLGL
jgi:Pyruvate/2-oxoacid:ferredoxin oxidoreductase gamma subunit